MGELLLAGIAEVGTIRTLSVLPLTRVVQSRVLLTYVLKSCGPLLPSFSLVPFSTSFEGIFLSMRKFCPASMGSFRFKLCEEV